MTKGKIMNEPITDERKRSSILKKREESLLKKADQLSVLCGVETCVVIHKPEQNNATLWPSPEIFGERLQKFLDAPSPSRTRKMVSHEKYKEKRVSDEEDSLAKLRKRNDLKECQQLMTSLIQGKITVSELDMNRATLLNAYAEEMLKKIQSRDDELNKPQVEQVKMKH